MTSTFEIAETLARFPGCSNVMNDLTATLPYGKQAPARDRGCDPPPSRACCCSTNPPPACPKASGTISWAAVAALAARCYGVADRARHGSGVLIRRPDFGIGERARCWSKVPRLRVAAPTRRGPRRFYLRRGRRCLISCTSRACAPAMAKAVVLPDLSLRLAEGPGAGAAGPQRHRQDHG